MRLIGNNAGICDTWALTPMYSTQPNEWKCVIHSYQGMRPKEKENKSANSGLVIAILFGFLPKLQPRQICTAVLILTYM